MSIDQARKSLLSRSLVQIAAQQQKIFLEMATMQEKRRELDVMESGSAQTIAEERTTPRGARDRRRRYFIYPQFKIHC